MLTRLDADLDSWSQFTTGARHRVSSRGLVWSRGGSLEVCTRCPVGHFRLDLLVEGTVPSSSRPRSCSARRKRQLINYLRASDLKVGLLFHFGPEPKFHRLVSPTCWSSTRQSSSLQSVSIRSIRFNPFPCRGDADQTASPRRTRQLHHLAFPPSPPEHHRAHHGERRERDRHRDEHARTDRAPSGAPTPTRAGSRAPRTRTG